MPFASKAATQTCTVLPDTTLGVGGVCVEVLVEVVVDVFTVDDELEVVDPVLVEVPVGAPPGGGNWPGPPP